MTNKLLSLARVALIAVAIFTSAITLLAGQARAEIVTVNGTDYDVQRLTGGWSDGNNEALIKASPWYTPNNSTLALAFANAYIAIAPNAYFVYQDNNNGFYKTTLASGGQVYNATVAYSDGSDLSGGNLMAATEAASVPEINTGALSQVMLMLLALWLVTRGRPETETPA